MGMPSFATRQRLGDQGNVSPELHVAKMIGSSKMIGWRRRRRLTDGRTEGGREREREGGREEGRAQILEAMSSSRKQCHLRQTGIRSIADTTKTNNDK